MPSQGVLHGKVALITGAASGIGLGIARRFAAEGAHVLMADLNGQAVKEASRTLGEYAQAVAADVSRQDDAESLVSAAVEAFGGLDVVVNSAGIIRYGQFPGISLEEWDDVQRINVTGSFLVARAAARWMLQQPHAGATRSMINMSSVEGHRAVSSSGHPQVHYNASKGAVHMMTLALAVDLAPAIRVNSICPGITETPPTKAARADQRQRAYYSARIPMQRFAQPEDIAAAATFLASNDASYITGVALPVDGGWMAG
jgi:NAD(P)-dependent dehydrogenase (short-subunit alcohol dehydrogenase family)